MRGLLSQENLTRVTLSPKETGILVMALKEKSNTVRGRFPRSNKNKNNNNNRNGCREKEVRNTKKIN